MAEISVFECGICFQRYNENDRLPLSLPCGHVFCKSCMKNMIITGSSCPIDKTKFPSTIESLPCCYAIFANLPRSNLGVSCSRHQKKKVKFMCKIHSKYLCTECVLEHTGPGHEIAAFTPNLDEMNKELQSLVEISQELIAEVKENLKSQQQQDKKIANFYDSQILKVSTSYDTVIRNLSNKKRELIESLKKSMKEQIMALEFQRLKNNKKLESAVNWATELKQVTNSLADISYEEFSAFLTLKKSELRTLTESRTMSDVSIKYNVFNGDVYIDTLEIKDYGSIALLKTEDKVKTCCGQEYCNCKNKDPDSLWKCKVCNHPNFKSNTACFYCKTSNTPDFSASQGPDFPKMSSGENKAPIARKESDKAMISRPRVVQRPKGYKKQNVIIM